MFGRLIYNGCGPASRFLLAAFTADAAVKGPRVRNHELPNGSQNKSNLLGYFLD